MSLLYNSNIQDGEQIIERIALSIIREAVVCRDLESIEFEIDCILNPGGGKVHSV